MTSVDEHMDANGPDDGAEGIGPAIVGSAGIALLIAAALLVGALPYAAALVGVAHLPHPGGLHDLGVLDVTLRAAGVFLIFALAEVPLDLAGKAVTIWMNLRHPGRGREEAQDAQRAGQLTSQLIKAALLTLLLSAWVTATLLGAILVALLTVVLESVLEPVVDRYVKR